MTLIGVMALIRRYFTEFGRFLGGKPLEPITSKWLNIDLYCLQHKCSATVDHENKLA